MDETFDFIIVGSGGGAMAAALVLRERGKSVLILEKTGLVGGATARSGGVLWIPNSRFVAGEDSADAANAYLDAVVGDHNDTPGATRARRRAYVEQAPAMLDFLIGHGIAFRRGPDWPDYYDEAPGALARGRTVVAELFDANRLGTWKAKLRPGFLPIPARLDEAMQMPKLKQSGAAKKTLLKVLLRAIGGRLRGKHWVTAGNALMGRMLDAALKAGAELRVDAPVKQIIVEDGRAAGVVAEIEGAERRIGARLGVLINAGGFAQNQAMLDRYVPGVSAAWSNAPEGDTGEMIEEAVRIGAATAQMDVRVCNQVALPPDLKLGALKPGVQNDCAKPHSIVVDQTGVRYMSEAGSYMDFEREMRARDRVVPAVPSWLVMDRRYLDRFMLAGTMPGAKKPKAWLESGFLKKADTLEGLAAACGMDPANLIGSVKRFNGFVRAGRDEDFHRGERAYERWLGDEGKTLGTVEQGPFTAIQVFPGDVGTFGGIVTDEHARVLRADGTPIPGLYATGTSTASVMGRSSPGAGSSIGPSFTWGYVAARHAAGPMN